MIKNDVGKRIKELRVEKGISQEDLALKCGLDRTYITYVENAKKNVTVETLFKITQALDIKLSDFFDMDESTSNVSSAKILQITDRKPLINIEEGSPLPAKINGHIEFKNVSFMYPSRNEYALNDLSFTL